MGIVLDLILAVLIILTVLNGYRKGFVKSIIGFLSFIASFVIACTLSPALKDFIYEKFIRSAIYNSVSEKIREILGGAADSFDIGKLIDNPPDSFNKLIEQFKIDGQSLSAVWQENVDKGIDTANDAVLSNIIDPAANAISMFIAFISVFLLSMIACMLISAIILKIVRLPLLRSADRTAGLLLGILFAYIYGSAAVIMMDMIIPYTTWGGDNFVASATILYKHLSSYNLLDYIMQNISGGF